jgi:hypothetical protein
MPTEISDKTTIQISLRWLISGLVAVAAVVGLFYAMEHRLAAQEARLTALETRLAKVEAAEREAGNRIIELAVTIRLKGLTP